MYLSINLTLFQINLKMVLNSNRYKLQIRFYVQIHKIKNKSNDS